MCCACRHVTESECRSMTTYFPLLRSNSGSISPPRFLRARLTSPNFNFLKINHSFQWAENNVELLVSMQSDVLWPPADNDHPEQESPNAPGDGVNHPAHTESPQVWNSDDFISVCFTFVFPLQTSAMSTAAGAGGVWLGLLGIPAGDSCCTESQREAPVLAALLKTTREYASPSIIICIVGANKQAGWPERQTRTCAVPFLRYGSMDLSAKHIFASN